MILHPAPAATPPGYPLGAPEQPGGPAQPAGTARAGLGTGVVLGLIFGGIWLVASEAIVKAAK